MSGPRDSNSERGQADLGALTLRGVSTVGQVFLVADESIRAGAIVIDGLVIKEADLRGGAERPHGYGVDALQGALTIWNRSPDPGVVLHAEIKTVSAGSEETPIRGSGVFVGGWSDKEAHSTGGAPSVPVLDTGPMVIDGGITPRTRI